MKGKKRKAKISVDVGNFVVWSKIRTKSGNESHIQWPRNQTLSIKTLICQLLSELGAQGLVAGGALLSLPRLMCFRVCSRSTCALKLSSQLKKGRVHILDHKENHAAWREYCS